MKTVSKYLAIPLLLSFAANAYADEKENEQEYRVQLHSLNGSGVTGEAKIKIKNGNTLEIKLEADGLEANKVHPQHIHGISSLVSRATCPDISADVNADGLVSVGEGAPFYGPIVFPLNPFDLVGDSGELNYKTKVSINPASIEPIGKRTIVLHGMTVNGSYVASLPIACGEVELED